MSDETRIPLPASSLPDESAITPRTLTRRQLLALAAWRAGDIPAAKHWFDIIATDIMTPADIRTRVEMLAALVAAQGRS